MISFPRVGVTLAGLFMIGYALLWWLAGKLSHHRALRRITLLSYVMRVFFAIGMYAISYFRWPILSSLQTEPGFWSFGLDASVYHYYGAEIAEAWRLGIELPKIDLGFDYFALIGGLYRLLGAHPLYPILLNGLLAAVSGLLVYQIGRRLFHERAGLWGALLVAVWPSTLIWGTQLLKDTLTWCLTLSCLLLVVSIVLDEGANRRARVWRLFRYLLLGCAVTVLTRLRFYLGSGLSLSAVIVLLPAGIYALFRKPQGKSVCMRYTGTVLTIVAAMLFARTLNLFELLSPPTPELAHYELALQAWKQGDLDQAVKEFHRAISLQPRYREAYLGLGAVQLQQAYWEGAIWAYEQCEQLEALNTPVSMKEFIGQLYFDFGNHHLKLRQREAAIKAYEEAIARAPLLAPAYANLGLALAQTMVFDRAFEMSNRALALSSPGAEKEQVTRAVALTYLQRGDHEFEACRQSHGNLEVATADYRQATQLDPSNANIYEAQLALWLARFGFFEEAFDIFERVLPQSQATLPFETRNAIARAYVLAGDRQYTEGHFATATSAYEQAIRLFPFVADAYVKRSVSLMEYEPSRLTWEVGEEWPNALQPAISREDNQRSVENESLRILPRYSERQGLALSTAMRLFSLEGGYTKKALLEKQFLQKKHTSIRVSDQVTRIVSETTPEALAYRRQGFVSSGGHSLVDPRARISSLQELLRYLPRALAIGLLAPFPWQWGKTSGGMGVMRAFASLEMLLWYLLIPAILAGILKLFKQRGVAGLFLLSFILLTAASVSLVVANLGTLFRLRLLFLLPLLVVAGGGDPVGFYKSLWHRKITPHQVLDQGPSGETASAEVPETAMPLPEPAPLIQSVEQSNGAHS